MNKMFLSGILISAGLFCFEDLAGAADAVTTRLDAARIAYSKSDLAGAARELDAVLAEIHKRLGKALAETLPLPFAGWQAEEIEIQGLGQAGGGLSVSRSYVRGDSSLNATMLVDSPAAEPVMALLTGGALPQSNSRRIKIGSDDALLRFDSSAKTGEISMVLNGRVLLEIEADNVTSADILMDAAKSWNVTKIRTLVY